ncbi:MAG: DUF3073 domain-containing protein [Mycobacterium sp.]
MGRGRAKAKQTKVARELKYSSPQTDFDRLQQELAGSGSGVSHDVDDDSWADEHDWRR